MEKRIFANGRIVTLEKERPFVEAVYTEGGRIRGLGSTKEILLQFGRPAVEIIDLEGGFACPGLTDNHLHLMAYGMKLSLLDFTGLTSKEGVLQALRERVERTPSGQWVLGLNWDENRMMEGTPLTREELDRVAPGHPVMLTRVCYHVQAVNSRAIEAAGLTLDAPDPAEGAFGRDARGQLNGLVYENASLPFREALPPLTFAEKKELARTAASGALARGLTAVHTEDLRDAGSVRDLTRIYRELTQEGTLLRTHHLIYHPFLEELRDAGLTAGDGDEWFRIGAAKIFADGSIGGRTAWLAEPYTDDPSTCGMAIHTGEEMNGLVREAREHGMPVAVHAIGDGAAEQVVRALEAIPLSGRFMPDRLIHAQILNRGLMERLQRLPMVLDIQPRFVVSDFPWITERVGNERLSFAYAWRTLLEAGIPCGGGSDAPIEPIDPLLGIHAAVTRRDPSDPEHPGWLPEQKITLLEALRLFTVGGARSVGEERERGTVGPGKWADLSVFDRDLLSGEPDTLLEARAVMTIVNGRVAYRV
ncbi:amidohydrolase [Salinithrix halophila]|uniref:Amidohydrolase n=1 Tax=Salinithrix halophila TaxID=1485204 RepID=A0ABV8JIN4_9BACL